jgi:transcriptional regulator with XRE-family HTH domain
MQLEVLGGEMALRGFEFLKTGRNIRGLTQTEVAEIYGVSERTYQRWERG